MIGKIPKTGRGFRGTYNYLVQGKRDSRNPERLAWMETRNLYVDDPNLIPRMMRATAAQSLRVQKPVYHFLISWRQDEAPADGTMRMVADQALGDLGLSEHQAVLAAHRDTDHRHLHIMVNRVHPETGKAWHTGKDWERLERSIARQALEHGFIKVDGRHNTPDKMAKEAKRARDGEYQMATRKHGTQPLDRWTQEEIRSRRLQLNPLFQQARSWDELDRLLRTEGLSLTAKGQGLVIDDGMGYMKLSDLGKDVRLKGLEGQYQEPFAVFEDRRLMSKGLADIEPAVQPVQPDQPAPSPVEPAPSPEPSNGHITDVARDRVREAWRASRKTKGRINDRLNTAGDEGADDTTTSAPPPQMRPRLDYDDLEQKQTRYDAIRKVADAKVKVSDARDLLRRGATDASSVLFAIDMHAAARADLAKLLLDNPDRDRIAEQWRQQSEAQRQAVEQMAERSSAASQPLGRDLSAKPQPQHQPQVQKPSPAPQQPKAPSARSEAFGVLSRAHESLNLAKSLHGAGLISKQDLVRARKDLDAARDGMSQHQTMGEFIANGVRETLRGLNIKGAHTRANAQPQQKPKAESAPSTVRPARKRKDKERER